MASWAAVGSGYSTRRVATLGFLHNSLTWMACDVSPSKTHVDEVGVTVLNVSGIVRIAAHASSDDSHSFHQHHVASFAVWGGTAFVVASALP